MGFEDILKQWETDKKKSRSVPRIKKEKRALAMEDILNLYPPEEEEESLIDESAPKRVKRRNYRRMKHQEVLDLHGYTVVSAKVELEDFIKRCKRRGIIKVLIIHGKGLHSEDGESVLRRTVRNFLMNCDSVGETGHPSERDGGSGATWAIIKN